MSKALSTTGGAETQSVTIDFKSLTSFFRSQGIYLFIAFVGCAIFWAIGQPINPFTVILYSLCIGNFLSPPMQWLHALYEKPAPYDWLIFLAVLCVVMFPVYALSKAENAQGEEFGVEKVAAFGKAHAASSAAEMNEQLLAQVSDFCGAQFQDDATLVVLAVN